MDCQDDSTPKPIARVLVADDNELCRSVVVGIVEEMGCRVDAVGNGAAAVAAARKVRYDLIFLDGIMPEMNGIEAARAIRRIPGQRGRAPIVSITGNPMQIPKADCLEAGVNEYIQKPISRKVYRQAVARWVHGWPEPSSRPESSP
ncbi:MAG TPA: response regulator [Phycisphaerae bacterium]|nr:response regulator [Phycisphaerae bacterium]